MGLLIGMKMILWNQVKAWVYALLGALLAGMGVFSVYYKKKAEKQQDRADTLTATVHAERTRKKIEKEKREELSRRESDIRKEKEKNDDAFTGFDNLSNPNDWD